MTTVTRSWFEVDGRPATLDQLHSLATTNLGHYTFMVARDGGVRGLRHHLDRLCAASRELFDHDLDAEVVRSQIRQALGSCRSASIRVTGFRPSPRSAPSIMVSVATTDVRLEQEWSLASVPYQRPVAHLKHLGTFAQTYWSEQARRQGFDDALLTTVDGVVTEAATANIAFIRAGSVIWPEAPVLMGVAWQLLEPLLGPAGLPTRRERVHLADVAGMAGAFLANARGLRTVTRIDQHHLPTDARVMSIVDKIYESIPHDPI